MPEITILRDFDQEYKMFRIMRFDHLFDCLTKKRVYFSNPSSWPDPYDSLILRSKIEKNGKTEKIPSGFFCQCWCRKRIQSDAMWRLYSPAGTNIMVHTTFSKLSKYYFNFPNQKVYAGEVCYAKQSDLKNSDFLKDEIPKISELDERSIAHSLLLKHHSYSHENEVRAIIPSSPKSKNGIYIDNPNLSSEFIFKVYTDPRSDDCFFEYVKTLLTSIGLRSNLIAKSALYTETNVTFKI